MGGKVGPYAIFFAGVFFGVVLVRGLDNRAKAARRGDDDDIHPTTDDKRLKPTRQSATNVTTTRNNDSNNNKSNSGEAPEKPHANSIQQAHVIAPDEVPRLIPFPSSPGKREPHSLSITNKANGRFLQSTEDLLSLNQHGMEPIMSHIRDSDESDEIIVLGICGGSGSGKTTLARAIYDTLGEQHITHITHDAYYKDLSHLPMEERDKQNFDHPDSLDTALLVKHLQSLREKKQVVIPTYDYSTHCRSHTNQTLPPRKIVMVEGILIFCEPALYEQMDIKIFVDTDDDIRFIRRIQRDTLERNRTLKSVINQYISTVRPMHLQFVEPSKRNADIIVPVGLNSVALDLVVSKLRASLAADAEIAGAASANISMDFSV